METSPLSTIYNLVHVAEGLETAGQPTTAQLAAIKDAGYEVIINLATGTTPRDLPNEAAVVATLGIEYIHIPVVWEHPTEADLRRFFAAMDATQDKKRFVHCIANMRVSAFVMMWLYSSGHTGTRTVRIIRGVFDEPTYDEKVFRGI
jgi:protein tyrosine phosphatase (PTP) superfamily phosphohydrolase (DUF442 family)